MFVACRRLTLRHLAMQTRTSRYGASVPSEWVGSYCQTKGEYGSHDSDPITPHGLVPTRGSTQWTALHFNCMCVSDTPTEPLRAPGKTNPSGAAILCCHTVHVQLCFVLLLLFASYKPGVCFGGSDAMEHRRMNHMYAHCSRLSNVISEYVLER